MSEPWSALKLCDFCGSPAVAIAPRTNENGDDAKWLPVCIDCLMGWWGDLPAEKRLPAFLLPSVPHQFAEHPIYEPQPIDPEEWARLCRLSI